MQDRVVKRRDLILNGKLWQAIILLAVPVAINEFIRATYNLIDALFVASIGSMEIAAISFVGPLNMLVRTISVGIAVGGTNLIARDIGKEDYDGARNSSALLVIVSLIIGIMITIFAFLFSKDILIAASASDAIMDISNVYFRLTVLSTPFVFLNSAYVSIKNADGNTLLTMYVNTIAMGGKVLLTYVFIFHMDLGIRGLAYSTIIGTGLVSLYAVYDLFIKKHLMTLSFKNLQFRKTFFTGLLLISLPLVFEKSSASLSFIVVNKYVISYGEKVLAAYGITNRINSMFFATVSGFAAGLAPIISQNLGAGKEERARQAIKLTFRIAIGIAIVLIAFVLPIRQQLAGYFAKDDSELLRHTVNAMSVYSISVIPWAIFQVTNGIFSGTGHTKYNMIISLLRIYAFRLPIIIVLVNYTQLNEYSIWYGMLISNVFTAVVAYLVYRTKTKDLKLLQI